MKTTFFTYFNSMLCAFFFAQINLIIPIGVNVIIFIRLYLLWYTNSLSLPPPLSPPLPLHLSFFSPSLFLSLSPYISLFLSLSLSPYISLFLSHLIFLSFCVCVFVHRDDHLNNLLTIPPPPHDHCTSSMTDGWKRWRLFNDASWWRDTTEQNFKRILPLFKKKKNVESRILVMEHK